MPRLNCPCQSSTPWGAAWTAYASTGVATALRDRSILVTHWLMRCPACDAHALTCVCASCRSHAVPFWLACQASLAAWAGCFFARRQSLAGWPGCFSPQQAASHEKTEHGCALPLLCPAASLSLAMPSLAWMQEGIPTLIAMLCCALPCFACKTQPRHAMLCALSCHARS